MKIISTKTVFTCPIFKVEERTVEVKNAVKEKHWVVVRQPNVSVVALTNEKKFVLIEQKRGKNNTISIEIPSGKLEKYNPSLKELENQALLELEEEAGFKANSIELLDVAEYSSNWRERKYYQYAAWDLNRVGQRLDHGEEITVSLASLADIEHMIKSSHNIIYDHEIDALRKGIAFFKKTKLI